MGHKNEIKQQMKEQAKTVKEAVKKYKEEYKNSTVTMLNHLRGVSTKLRSKTFTEYQQLAQDINSLKKSDYNRLSTKAIEELKSKIKTKEQDIESKYHSLNDLDAKNKALYDLITQKTGKEYNFSNAHDIIEFVLDIIKSE